ncbi:hypothetical protein APHAL10511_005588 [Amanita phalloides]|nr:hypothetical protein APHAL10511_005588 [Amanita phalloides]
MSNPDTRLVPPGWHQHFNTPRQSRSSTPVPVLELEPIEPSADASSGSFIRSFTPDSAKLSTAQQLYASAINKINTRSSSPGLKSSPAKTSQLSPPSAQKRPSTSSLYLFPDPSQNAQPAGSTELYNRTVASQQGGTIPSPFRNVDSRQAQSFDPSGRRSQSVQLPPLPRNGSHQPQRALTEATLLLDLINRNNPNVVIIRPTRMGETPTIAMIARPASDQRNHPDTLTSPPLYGSSGPSIRYDTNVSLPPASLLSAPPNARLTMNMYRHQALRTSYPTRAPLRTNLSSNSTPLG